MQNAMSAKTLLFRQQSGSKSLADRYFGHNQRPQISPTAEPSEALEPDFGATIAFDSFPSVQPMKPTIGLN